MQERRMFERFKVDFPVKFVDLDNNKEGTGRMIDISAGGGGMIVTKEPLHPQTHLELWFHIPDKMEPLHSMGIVVWSSMVDADVYRVGLKFEKIDFMGISRAFRVKRPPINKY